MASNTLMQKHPEIPDWISQSDDSEVEQLTASKSCDP